jgi:predicted dehydrogenase
MDDILFESKPKVGFLGVGWIGRNRLEAIKQEGIAEITAFSDPDNALCDQASQLIPESKQVSSLSELLSCGIEGVIIATPSALHAHQSIEAINQGKAVFCQKPLGRNAKEVEQVVRAAEARDVLLRVDFSYRFTAGIKALKQLIDSRQLGDIYGINLVFHNAYGPDKPWYFDPKLSGGGCLMDLGVHLVDLLVWLFDNPRVSEVCSQLFSGGSLLSQPNQRVEDYAVAQFLLNDSISVQLACSWNLPAGTDAVIEVSLYGTRGGVSFKNVNGSFYDFITEHLTGTSKELISFPGDRWGGKAAIAWAKELGTNGNRFNREALQYITTAGILDKIYKGNKLIENGSSE